MPAKKGISFPIDEFFREIAREYNEKAVGIIFSGTGSDGALGLTSIKESGGLTIVQDPSSTQYYSMPNNAIERKIPSTSDS